MPGGGLLVRRRPDVTARSVVRLLCQGLAAREKPGLGRPLKGLPTEDLDVGAGLCVSRSSGAFWRRRRSLVLVQFRTVASRRRPVVPGPSREFHVGDAAVLAAPPRSRALVAGLRSQHPRDDFPTHARFWPASIRRALSSNAMPRVSLLVDDVPSGFWCRARLATLTTAAVLRVVVVNVDARIGKESIAVGRPNLRRSLRRSRTPRPETFAGGRGPDEENRQRPLAIPAAGDGPGAHGEVVVAELTA